MINSSNLERKFLTPTKSRKTMPIRNDERIKVIVSVIDSNIFTVNISNINMMAERIISRTLTNVIKPTFLIDGDLM
jgi:hypothetical protein